jgi:hypothetical protein
MAKESGDLPVTGAETSVSLLPLIVKDDFATSWLTPDY